VATLGAAWKSQGDNGARGNDAVTEREKLGAKLDPALRELADRVIIPALAREFLAQGKTKRIAGERSNVAEFKVRNRLSAEVTP
jgi:hypothetical protein